MSVWVRLGLVPRRLTRSDSSKPPSSALDELMFTPGRPRRASAHVVCRELADVFGRHDFQARVGIALDFKRFLETRADARDDDFVELLDISS